MPHPATDAHVHLEQHPDHPHAVTATITGPGAYIARALLSLHGFRPAGEQMMILARIDHEEPHYADQAARALRDEGATVGIAPGLQEDIDTEWTWAEHPMHWLSRDEVREVSNEAQKIYDDITTGRLTIHLHAHDGWTVVAVGTYRDGKSVHLHGENHLRQVALVFDTPTEAIQEFQGLHGDAVRPGPAPATDTERAVEKALTDATTAPPTTPSSTVEPEPAKPKPKIIPVYAAEPADHEALLDTFLASQGEWQRYRTWDDDTTVAAHESLALRAEFVHQAAPQATNWTIAAYESPVGDRLWHATATASTPIQIISTLLDELASDWTYAAARSTDVSAQAVIEAMTPLAEAGWKQSVDGRRMQWTPPNGDAAGVQFDAFADRSPVGQLPAWRIWGGNTFHQPAWVLRFSPHVPVGLLHSLTIQLAYGKSVRHTPTPPPTRQHQPAACTGTSGTPPSPTPPAPRRNR